MKAEAARLCPVNIWCIQDWWQRPDLTPKRHRPRRHKLDRLAQRHHLAQHPDATLKDLIQHFGIAIHASCMAIRQMKILEK